MDGVARGFNFSYTAKGGEIYSTDFAGAVNENHFVYDAWVRLDNPDQIINVEMDINHVVANGDTVILATQCSGYAKSWEFTTVSSKTGGASSTHWNPSNIPCDPRTWTPKQWNHIQIATHHDSSGNVTYDWIGFNGVYTAFKGASGPSAESLHWGHVAQLQFQLDGASSSGGSASAYVDNLTIYRW